MLSACRPRTSAAHTIVTQSPPVRRRERSDSSRCAVATVEFVAIANRGTRLCCCCCVCGSLRRGYIPPLINNTVALRRRRMQPRSTHRAHRFRRRCAVAGSRSGNCPPSLRALCCSGWRAKRDHPRAGYASVVVVVVVFVVLRACFAQKFGTSVHTSMRIT